MCTCLAVCAFEVELAAPLLKSSTLVISRLRNSNRDHSGQELNFSSSAGTAVRVGNASASSTRASGASAPSASCGSSTGAAAASSASSTASAGSLNFVPVGARKSAVDEVI